MFVTIDDRNDEILYAAGSVLLRLQGSEQALTVRIDIDRPPECDVTWTQD